MHELGERKSCVSHLTLVTYNVFNCFAAKVINGDIHCSVNTYVHSWLLKSIVIASGYIYGTMVPKGLITLACVLL